MFSPYFSSTCAVTSTHSDPKENNAEVRGWVTSKLRSPHIEERTVLSIVGCTDTGEFLLASPTMGCQGA